MNDRNFDGVILSPSLFIFIDDPLVLCSRYKSTYQDFLIPERSMRKMRCHPSAHDRD